VQCNAENLQMYLDGELEFQARKSLETHLGQCRKCRQEMARLQLLWRELEQTEEKELPLELSFLGQQIIHQALSTRQKNMYSKAGYWEAQKLAWKPAIIGAGYLPGVTLLSAAGRAASNQLPRLKSGVFAMARKLIFPAQDKKGGA
jgi:predicted anti-sigma-YlaC factor YlaD